MVWRPGFFFFATLYLVPTWHESAHATGALDAVGGLHANTSTTGLKQPAPWEWRPISAKQAAAGAQRMSDFSPWLAQLRVAPDVERELCNGHDSTLSRLWRTDAGIITHGIRRYPYSTTCASKTADVPDIIPAASLHSACAHPNRRTTPKRSS